MLKPGGFVSDVLVIGGGIQGAAIAREAALRGAAVLLVERGDFGCATSSTSSRLIHGGLRYVEQGQPVIAGTARISRPGRRVYVGKQDVPKTRGGLGVTIVSTSKGVMTERECRRAGLGGEVLCSVW